MAHRNKSERVVYLLCLSRPMSHAKHYLGSSINVDRRLSEHRAGRGSKFTQAVVRAGIDLILVQVWPGERYEERLAKLQKNAARMCPRCREEFLARDRARRKAKRLAKKQELMKAPMTLPLAA